MSKLLMVDFGLVVIMIISAVTGIVIGANAYSEPTVTVKAEKTYCGSSTLQLTGVHIKDTNGNIINKTIQGSPVLVEVSVTSNCEINNYPILIALDVRDADEVTGYFAYQNVTMNRGEQITISFSWLPERIGDHNIRVISHACLRCSGDLGIIRNYEFSVIGAPRDFNNYALSIGNKTFAVPYRFSSGGDARIVDFTVDRNTASMLVTVEVPKDNTLEIHLPVEMLKQMEGSGKYAYYVGTGLVIFVDEINADGMWQYIDNEEIATIKLGSGARMIEIVGTFPIG